MARVWRDRWDDVPDVVVIAPDDPEDGTLYGAILCLRESVPEPKITLTDERGARLVFTLPDDYVDEDRFTFGVDIDLPVEEP